MYFYYKQIRISVTKLDISVQTQTEAEKRHYNNYTIT